MSCKAPGFSQSESESALENSAILEDATSELDYEEAYEQLERMKQRVLQMKSMILGTLEPGTDPVRTNSDRLREIQAETSQTCQQIEAVRSRLKESNEELNTLTERIQVSGCCTNTLAKQLEEVPQWMEEQRHHVGVCLERYQELDATCCSYLDYSSHMRPILRRLKSQLSVRVPLKCYKLDYMKMQANLSQPRELLHQTREQLMANIKDMEETLTTEPSLELHPVFSERSDLSEGLDGPRRSSLAVRRCSRAKELSRMSRVSSVTMDETLTTTWPPPDLHPVPSERSELSQGLDTPRRSSLSVRRYSEKYSRAKELSRMSRVSLVTMDETLNTTWPTPDLHPGLSERNDLSQGLDTPRRSSLGVKRYSERHSWAKELPKIGLVTTVLNSEADK